MSDEVEPLKAQTDAKPKPQRPADVRQAKRKFVDEFWGNHIVIEVTLVTPEVQRIYSRHFDGLSRAVFFLRYYTEQLRDPQIVQSIFKEVDNKFAETRQTIRQKGDLADQLLAEGNINCRRGSGTTLAANIIDPFAHDYLVLLQEGDQLATKYVQLWLGRILKEEQYRQAHNELSKSLRLLHSSISKLSLGVRDRARGVADNITKADSDAQTPSAAVAAPSENIVDSVAVA